MKEEKLMTAHELKFVQECWVGFLFCFDIFGFL